MALKAGRVGVATSEVDEFGHITGGGTPENVYTKTQCDNKFETKTHASNTYETKENIGGLKFRDNDGTAQYQLSNGEWTNFSSGGSDHLGWYVPPDLLDDTGLTFANTITEHSGGVYRDTVNHILYIDITVTISSGGVPNSSAIVSFGSGMLNDVIDSLSSVTYNGKGNGDALWSNSSADTKLDRDSGYIYNPYSSYFSGVCRFFGAYALSQ